jgi:hypothetical protein
LPGFALPLAELFARLPAAPKKGRSPHCVSAS